MPASSRPGIWRSRGAVAPPHSTVASKPRRSAETGRSTPISTPGRKMTPSCAMMREAAIEQPLLHLELGNPVPQQPADAIGALEHRHLMPGLVQLIGGRQPGRARADDRDAPAGPHRPAASATIQPSSNARSTIASSMLLIVTGSSLMPSTHDPSHGRRAQAAGELRKVVRRVQPVDRRLPAIPVGQIVPVRDQVPERTALMAERDPAVHAARALRLHVRLGLEQVDLFPVADPHLDRPRLRLGPPDLHEAGDLTHAPPPRAPRTPARDSPTARAPPPSGPACSRAE